MTDVGSGSARHPVVLVGAGPGDPDLLTVLGARALAAANVVGYDSLVHPLVLQRYAAHAEQIYVGKRWGGTENSRPTSAGSSMKAPNRARASASGVKADVIILSFSRRAGTSRGARWSH